MADDDWFRAPDWDKAAQDHFREKLERSRDQKWFYLRLKAKAIAPTHPQDALALLAEYIAADTEHWQEGHYEIAAIELACGDHDAAFAALDCAMGEDGHGLGAMGVMENAFLSALYRRKDRYERALALIDHWDASAMKALGRKFHRSFAGNFGEALILFALGRAEEAQAPARAALEQQLSVSGPLPGHPGLGNPANISSALMRQLVWIAGLWDATELGEPPREFGMPETD